LGKSRTTQIGSSDERELLKAIALSWLQTHRRDIKAQAGEADLSLLDTSYQSMLSAAGRRPVRRPLLDLLKICKSRLIVLRSELAIKDATSPVANDLPPDFSPLASDARMQSILLGRWHETLRCIGAEAYLAATVMMGGLLEALLMARVEKLSNKRPVFTAVATPRDKAGKTVEQNQWTLRHYIDIAHELGWITKSAKDIGEVLRDYRNFIHPHKEYSHRITLCKNDGIIFWGVTKTIAVQVIESVT